MQLGHSSVGDLGVGGFVVVVVPQLGSGSDDLPRILLIFTQSSDGQVDVVDAVVDQVAAAIIPKPVPLVVPAVSGERMFWRGSEPEVIIDASGQPGRFGAILQNVCLTPHRCAVVVITLFHWFFEKLFACSALSDYDDIRTAIESSLCERHR